MRRLKNRYRLVILKDYDLAEKASFSIRGLNVLAFFSIILLITFLLFWALFSYTPLNYFLPTNHQVNKERKLTQLSRKTDSLTRIIENRRSYFENIKTILKGNVPDSTDKFTNKTNSNKNLKARTTSIELESDLNQDSLLNAPAPKNQNFSRLPKRTDDVSKTISLEKLTFFPPLEGLITSGYDGESGHYAVDVVAPRESLIKAIKDGTVIYTGWSSSTGHVMVIQHPHNLLSVYKHNSELLTNVGNFVEAGEAIGVVGTSGQLSTGPHLHFELWQKGNPLDPQSYINFE